jgi:hypothetical protein
VFDDIEELFGSKSSGKFVHVSLPRGATIAGQVGNMPFHQDSGSDGLRAICKIALGAKASAKLLVKDNAQTENETIAFETSTDEGGCTPYGGATGYAADGATRGTPDDCDRVHKPDGEGLWISCVCDLELKTEDVTPEISAALLATYQGQAGFASMCPKRTGMNALVRAAGLAADEGGLPESHGSGGKPSSKSTFWARVGAAAVRLRDGHPSDNDLINEGKFKAACISAIQKHRPDPKDRKFVVSTLALGENTLAHLHSEVCSIGGCSFDSMNAQFEPSAAAVAAEAAASAPAAAASQARAEQLAPLQDAHEARMSLLRVGTEGAWAEANQAYTDARQAFNQACINSDAAVTALQSGRLQSGLYTPAAQAAFQEQCALAVQAQVVWSQAQLHYTQAGEAQLHYNQTKDDAGHKCPHCGDAFGQASNLRVHIETVHEKRRDHKCPHCGDAFGQGGTLKRHIERKH